MDLMPLRRHQSAATVDLASRPSRVNQIAVTVYTEKLKGGIADTRPARFPMPDRSDTDVKKLRGLLTIKTTENASVVELRRGDDVPSRLLA